MAGRYNLGFRIRYPISILGFDKKNYSWEKKIPQKSTFDDQSGAFACNLSLPLSNLKNTNFFLLLNLPPRYPLPGLQTAACAASRSSLQRILNRGGGIGCFFLRKDPSILVLLLFISLSWLKHFQFFFELCFFLVPIFFSKKLAWCQQVASLSSNGSNGSIGSNGSSSLNVFLSFQVSLTLQQTWPNVDARLESR